MQNNEVQIAQIRKGIRIPQVALHRVNIKQERVDGELQGARQKLDGALQVLVEKAEESSSSSDESIKNMDIQVKKEDLAKLSDVIMPLRRTIRRPGRKRKSKDEYSLKNSYILKLFDRSVDLALFSPDTPLYPVCRAWIRNKPRNRSPSSPSHSRTPSPILEDPDVIEESTEDGSIETSKNVYQLPAPIPPKYAFRSPRIPSPPPKRMEENMVVSSSDDAPSHESLLTKHILRWRAVRQKWKDASFINDERYRESTNMLKAMYDNAFPKEEPWSVTTSQ